LKTFFILYCYSISIYIHSKIQLYLSIVASIILIVVIDLPFYKFTMKILYYDCFSGISGDMNLGALVDLGVPVDYLLSELKKIHLDGYKIIFSKELKMGISGTKATVNLAHDDHGHHHHKKADSPVKNFQNLSMDLHTEKGHHHQAYRNLHNINNIIENSSLNEYVKEKSKAMFMEIAVAEAKIHAKTIDDIHFHEVGAVDSIIDMIGAAICIDYLKPEKIISTPIELGGGFVKCAHGTFPIPAPATAEILKNIPVRLGRVDKETTTPTGAAILKVFVDEYVSAANMSIQKTAYGIGHRDLEIPNVLRVHLGEIAQSGNEWNEAAILIECNIDDMNPEHYEFLMDKIFENGAQDVFLVPIIMKKSRPAVQLKVLCTSDTQKKIEDIILKETTSLGLRFYDVTKSILKRKIRTVDTRFGPIRIKEAFFTDNSTKYKAEYEDCAKAALQMGISLFEVYDEVNRCMNL
jgi:uncharacterized protein (TIGR00299 family) protein